MRRPRRFLGVVFFSTAWLAGCSTLLGLDQFREGNENTGGGSSSSSSSSGTGGNGETSTTGETTASAGGGGTATSGGTGGTGGTGGAGGTGTPCDPTNTGFVVASNQGSPGALAESSGFVYWANAGDGTIARTSTVLGTVATIVSSNAVVSTPAMLAADAANIYLGDANNGAIALAPIGTGIPALLTTAGILRKLTVDSENLFWTDPGSGGGAVMKVPLSGGSPVKLAGSTFSVNGIAVDATSVYWTEGDKVRKVPVGGGVATTLASNLQSASDIAIDAGSVYWTQSLAGSSGAILSTTLDGGPLKVLASGQNMPQQISVASGNIYWLNAASGEIMQLSTLGDAPPKTVVCGLPANKVSFIPAAGAIFLTNAADGTVRSFTP
jgi:hypothetical protein